jgi:hypothetical protein
VCDVQACSSSRVRQSGGWAVEKEEFHRGIRWQERYAGNKEEMYVCVGVFIQRISLAVHVNHLASVKRKAYTSYYWHW